MATEMLKQLNFTEGALGQNLLAEDIGHLLDGDTFAGLDVGSRAALCHQHVSNEYHPLASRPTTRYHRLPGQAPLSHCIARSR